MEVSERVSLSGQPKSNALHSPVLQSFQCFSTAGCLGKKVLLLSRRGFAYALDHRGATLWSSRSRSSAAQLATLMVGWLPAAQSLKALASHSLLSQSRSKA
jgi:hypothetical protein